MVTWLTATGIRIDAATSVGSVRVGILLTASATATATGIGRVRSVGILLTDTVTGIGRVRREGMSFISSRSRSSSSWSVGRGKRMEVVHLGARLGTAFRLEVDTRRGRRGFSTSDPLREYYVVALDGSVASNCEARRSFLLVY